MLKKSIHPAIQFNTLCNEELNNKFHQCSCGICWIASSFIALKFSNIDKFMNPIYKTKFKNIYDIFSKTDISLYSKMEIKNRCPHIDKEIIDFYRYMYNLKLKSFAKIRPLVDDDRDMLYNTGQPDVFLYSIMKHALRNEYSISYNTYKDSDFVIKNIFVKKSKQIRLDMNPSKVAKFLHTYQKYYNKRGYMFESGTIITTNPKYNLNGKDIAINHSMAFSMCNNNYYLCNTANMGCYDLTNPSENFIEHHKKYKHVVMITFILKRIGI